MVVQSVLYASGNAGKVIVLSVFDVILLFYLTMVAGLSLVDAGIILLVAAVLDAVGDTLVSFQVDRSSRDDLLRWLLYLGAPLCGLSFIGIFQLAPGWPMLTALFCWLCRIGFTLCDVAHNALLVNLSPKERQATTITSLRLLFSASGTIATGLAFKMAVSMPDEAARQAAFQNIAWAGGAIYISSLLVATRLRNNCLMHREALVRSDVRSLLRSLFGNLLFRRVCVLVILQAGVTGLFMKGLPYIGRSLFDDPAWAGLAMLLLSIGQIAMLGLFLVLGHRMPATATVMRAAHALMAVALPLLLATALLAPVLAFPVLLLIGAAQGSMTMALWARLALVIRHEIGPTAALHAFPIGVFLAVLKISAGAGNGLLALALAGGVDSGLSEATISIGIAMLAPLLSSLACWRLARRF
ncbi:MFS transporter [Niveispirillum sp. BGYR6]|uniref:MFS transporter n=1 Tax=Niveispirillum sp. BGYR6 TaxID=2971249 RepID=UPI0022B99DA0|nr:MFS transporter [Niveispirillum sp. BGYR6]MDG5494820.1 MFS transporter [Niveispirillum sp. BGYR6]